MRSTVVTFFLLSALLALIAAGDSSVKQNAEQPLVSPNNKIEVEGKKRMIKGPPQSGAQNEVVKKEDHSGHHHNRRLDGHHHKQREMNLGMLLGRLNRGMIPEDARSLTKKVFHDNLDLKAIKRFMGKFAKTKRGRHMLRAMKVWKKHHAKKVHVAKKSNKKDKN